MENRLEEFKTYLFDKERSINTVDSYARSVGAYFKKYDEVNKKNMMEFKQWQIESWKPRTAAVHRNLCGWKKRALKQGNRRFGLRERFAKF